MNLSRVYPVRFSSSVSNWGQGYPEITESMRNYKIPSMTLRTEADMYRDLGKNLQNSRVRLTKPEIAQAIKYGWEPNDAPISFIDSSAADGDVDDDGDSDGGDGDERELSPLGEAGGAAAGAARTRAHHGKRPDASPYHRAMYLHGEERYRTLTDEERGVTAEHGTWERAAQEKIFEDSRRPDRVLIEEEEAEAEEEEEEEEVEGVPPETEIQLLTRVYNAFEISRKSDLLFRVYKQAYINLREEEVRKGSRVKGAKTVRGVREHRASHALNIVERDRVKLTEELLAHDEQLIADKVRIENAKEERERERKKEDVEEKVADTPGVVSESVESLVARVFTESDLPGKDETLFRAYKRVFINLRDSEVRLGDRAKGVEATRAQLLHRADLALQVLTNDRERLVGQLKHAGAKKSAAK